MQIRGIIWCLLLVACNSEEVDQAPVPAPCGFYTPECTAAVDACEEPDPDLCEGVYEACVRYDCSSPTPPDPDCSEDGGDCIDDQVVCEARATGCWRRLDACASQYGAAACCELELACVEIEQRCAELAAMALVGPTG